MAYIDPVEVSPDVYSVLFENDSVRVLDMAGQTDVEHSHTDETVIFVKGGKASIAMPDGNSMEGAPGWPHHVARGVDAHGDQQGR